MKNSFFSVVLFVILVGLTHNLKAITFLLSQDSYSIHTINSVEELSLYPKEIGIDWRLPHKDNPLCKSFEHKLALDKTSMRCELYAINKNEEVIGSVALFTIPFSKADHHGHVCRDGNLAHLKSLKEILPSMQENSFVFTPGWLFIKPENQSKQLEEAIIERVIAPQANALAASNPDAKLWIIFSSPGNASIETRNHIIKTWIEKKRGVSEGILSLSKEMIESIEQFQPNSFHAGIASAFNCSELKEVYNFTLGHIVHASITPPR